MTLSAKSETFRELADLALKKAKKLGASQSVVELSESSGRSVSVRLGKVETIEQMQDRSLDVTVYNGKSKGEGSTSDFSAAAIEEAVQKAFDIARFTASDPCAGLPDESDMCKRQRDLDLCHPWKLSTAKAIDKALATEQAALEVSKQVRNSDGATVESHDSVLFLADSRGFGGCYPESSHSISCSVIAKEKKSGSGPMYRDWAYSTNRKASELKKPKKLGQQAAHRALAKIGARQLSTRKCPVVFEPRIAVSLIRSYLNAIYGDSLYREESFLLDSMGKKVWANHISLKEDPFIPGAWGSSPFDHDGVKVAARSLVKRGVVNGYLLPTYAARRLGLKPTGNAGGAHNIIVSSTSTVTGGLDALLKEMGTGLLVTEMMGQGVNRVTGDYSRGAFGYWVEGGVITHPVEEITIAGNLNDMFAGVSAMGDDVECLGSISVGSLLIDSMTLAGG